MQRIQRTRVTKQSRRVEIPERERLYQMTPHPYSSTWDVCSRPRELKRLNVSDTVFGDIWILGRTKVHTPTIKGMSEGVALLTMMGMTGPKISFDTYFMNVMVQVNTEHGHRIVVKIDEPSQLRVHQFDYWPNKQHVYTQMSRLNPQLTFSKMMLPWIPSDATLRRIRFMTLSVPRYYTIRYLLHTHTVNDDDDPYDPAWWILTRLPRELILTIADLFPPGEGVWLGHLKSTSGISCV